MGIAVRRLVLDVSNNNTIDATRLRAAQVAALICKATEGTHFRDSTLAEHRAAAHAAGVAFGSYLFLRPDASGDQASYYLTYAKPRRGELQPIIDAEATDGASMAAVAARVDVCATTLEAHGYRPILYASASFWQSLYAERPRLRRLPVWEADYPGRFTRWAPQLAALRIRLRHGATVVLWQWTDRYAVGDRHYDASRLLARLDDLRHR